VTAVGDAAFKKKSKALLEEKLSRANVIYTSHSMDEIARLCNVVVVLRPGEATVFHDVKAGIAAYQKPPVKPVPSAPAAPAVLTTASVPA
jgi:capsular polysaccharide transport system ATP-binding protein